jgi:hypothetical protein
MTSIKAAYSPSTAAPGHVTFSILDQNEVGQTVMIANKDFPRFVQGVKKLLKKVPVDIFFDIAYKMVQSASVGPNKCNLDPNRLLSSFVISLLTHPDKSISSKLKNTLNSMVRKTKGAHVKVLLLPSGDAVWCLEEPDCKLLG